MATCRECKLWDRQAAMDKAGRIRRDRTARCLWASNEVWPLSVDSRTIRPIPGSMGPLDGNRCQRFIPVARAKERGVSVSQQENPK